MKIMHCYSDGSNPDFSAFNAWLSCGETIERLYQRAKRDINGNPYPKGQEKGKPASFMHICGQNVPCTGEHVRIRYTYYTMLWQVWFFENPRRYNEACEYEGFVDKYDRMSGKLYKPGDDYQAEKGCAQSASIAYLVGSDNELPHNPEIIAKAFTKYWKRYHPEMPIAENWQ